VREDLFLSRFTPSRMAAAAYAADTLGTSKPRDISVSVGPTSTACTLMPGLASSGRRFWVSENAAALDTE
jgi:hypothetical protein